MVKHGLAVAAIAAAFLLGGCAGGAGVVDRGAERLQSYGEVRLGPACSPEVRLFRAEELTELVAEYVGRAAMRSVDRALELMRQAAASDVPEALEVAAQAYRATLAVVLADYLRARVPGLVIGPGGDPLDLLGRYVDLRVELAAIKIAVLVRCAGVGAGGAS